MKINLQNVQTDLYLLPPPVKL